MNKWMQAANRDYNIAARLFRRRLYKQETDSRRDGLIPPKQ
jgi:hypothetical protein